MTGFPKVKCKDVANALRKIGHRAVRSRGSHTIYADAKGQNPVTLVMKDPSAMLTRTVWSGVKAQLGEAKLAELLKHL